MRPYCEQPRVEPRCVVRGSAGLGLRSRGSFGVQEILLLLDRAAGIQTNCGLGLLSAWVHSRSCELYRLGRREQDLVRNGGRNGGRWDLPWC